MCRNTLFDFPYISKDETLLRDTHVISLDPQTTIIKGVLCKPVYDRAKAGSFLMTGFFVEFDGVEYGSLDVTPEEFYAAVANCSNGGRIHVDEFDRPFV